MSFFQRNDFIPCSTDMEEAKTSSFTQKNHQIDEKRIRYGRTNRGTNTPSNWFVAHNWNERNPTKLNFIIANLTPSNYNLTSVKPGISHFFIWNSEFSSTTDQSVFLVLLLLLPPHPPLPPSAFARWPPRHHLRGKTTTSHSFGQTKFDKIEI